jgi:hypothetical protein
VQVMRSNLDAFMTCCVGRRDDYALQQADGRYFRVGQPVTYEAVFAHLQGTATMGSYVIGEQGMTRFAVFDSDHPSGLGDLWRVKLTLAGAGVASYLEASRRGAHLWVFLAEPSRPASVRAWLLPYCPAGVEFYPKQDTLSASVPLGSLVRLPLGVHRLSGERYPFVTLVGGAFEPLAPSVIEMLRWFGTVERVAVPATLALSTQAPQPTSRQGDIPFQPSSPVDPAAFPSTIRDWCRLYDPVAVIGRYVALDQRGMGCCPFGAHHAHGVDRHPSLWVYRPAYPDICCWYCHVWKQGGSLFDFLRYYYNLSPADLWQRLQAGARF